ncbi:WD repeat-containing protein 46 [Lycorma delicatula]|uniref:WD repeat-containing protein 46 n=1 Tax=Lycorma delicatula TaxID=130591 RepID=UPI003F5180DB
MRYFDKVNKSPNKSSGLDNNEEIKVYEGGLAEGKKRKTKHLEERKKHKDRLKKIANLSKDNDNDVNVQNVHTKLVSKYKLLAEKKKKRNKNESNSKVDHVSVPKEKLQKYSRGDGFEGTGVKTKLMKKKLLQKEQNMQWAAEQAARAEILLLGESGAVEAEDGEVTRQYRQKEIVNNVDITSAKKSFELRLRQFGPYRMNFTRNGRYLTLGGRRGHVAAFDWITKKLMFEINVMENVFDVHWLHNELMVAVAQKEWVYVYDNQGVELHCLKTMNRVLYLDFLPYHFLLSSINEDGWLSWLDVSIGKIVSQTSSHVGRPASMVQNPYNAVICVGDSKGVVSMWSPTVKKPLAKMLCHKMTVQGMAIDHRGLYMATSSQDHSLKIWDIRNLDGPLQKYQLRSNATNLAFSQKGFLATALGNFVEIYTNCCQETAEKSYLKHYAKDFIADIQFCPYEDVLGIGTNGGYQSILVPGSGEPDFDAYEANPFQTKKQRREAEVKSLLDKIQPDMITLEPTSITEVDVPTLRDKLEAKKQLLFVKPPKIDFTPRVKKKRHGNTVRMAKSKKVVRAEAKQEFIKMMKNVQQEVFNENAENDVEQQQSSKSVLDRFKQNKKKSKKNFPSV